MLAKKLSLSPTSVFTSADTGPSIYEDIQSRLFTGWNARNGLLASIRKTSKSFLESSALSRLFGVYEFSEPNKVGKAH